MYRLIIISLLLVYSLSSACQELPDEKRIKETVMAYVDSWWHSNVLQAEGALHPDMKKMIVVQHPYTKQDFINSYGRSTYIEYIRANGNDTIKGIEIPATQIKILDYESGIASVKVENSEFLDYIQLVKWNDEWKILNVVWGKPEEK